MRSKGSRTEGATESTKAGTLKRTGLRISILPSLKLG
jgi:hypothetical protein